MPLEPMMQQGNFLLLDEMGSRLSLELHCPIIYGAYNKPMFQCKHGISFPEFQVTGCLLLKDWSFVRLKHDELKRD